MKNLFQKLLSIEDVKGVIHFSSEGEILFKKMVFAFTDSNDEDVIWNGLLKGLSGIREADLIFDNLRLYVRKTHIGFLIVVMGIFAPAAMVRLNCDMILPSLKEYGGKKGLRRFFGI